jgi:Mg2+ and Co2+ transporter CorA
MNLFVVLIVVVIMLIAAVSYAKGQRTKRKAAEAYVKDLQRDLASMAEHNQELQKINRKNSEKLAELVATPDTDLNNRANDLFGKLWKPAACTGGILMSSTTASFPTFRRMRW